MHLKKITIRNFKAIEEVILELAEFNVIVGANGSGKSSVLQAMHWMFQSGRNRNIKANARGEGALLSEKHASFMPSPDYRNAGNGPEYGNKKGAPQLGVVVEAQIDDGSIVTADMWIKSARNEGLSVHVPSGNGFVAIMRSQGREFSAYIPGLAGIPLSEDKRSKLNVRRLAAAGDANTVLRNVLLLLKGLKENKKDGLSQVQTLVSRVMGDIVLEVDFDEDRHSSIQARFQTVEMKQLDAKRFKPLELAGIGFLQVIQIFAYLVYFRPVVLLVDEPDSHLHPTAQERLVIVLIDASREFGTQTLITTHSPSTIRALPHDACVVWMKNGKVQPNGNTEGRRLMGWGLLDRRILFITEDSNAGMIQALLAQWPDLHRIVAVWPFGGSTTLPSPDVITSLVGLTDDKLKVVLHRDRDFLMPIEIDRLQEPYERVGHKLWLTKESDIEAYWIEPDVVAAHFNIDISSALEMINHAVTAACIDDKALKKRREKRKEAINKINKNSDLPQYGDGEVENEACTNGHQHQVLGKELMSLVREIAKQKGMKNASNFGKSAPVGLNQRMASDLETVLRGMIF